MKLTERRNPRGHRFAENVNLVAGRLLTKIETTRARRQAYYALSITVSMLGGREDSRMNPVSPLVPCDEYAAL